MKRVLICTPCYNGLVHHGYLNGVIKVLQQGHSRGYDVGVYTLTDSLVTRARNNAVATFLAGGWDYLFWIDADIGFEPDQFFRILDLDRRVVAAAYPLKTLFLPDEPVDLAGEDLRLSMIRYAINLTPGTTSVPEDGFIPVLEAATGFMCIARDTFTSLIEHYPEMAYTSDQVENNGHHYLFFDTMVHEGRYLSEDYAFCKRVSDIGIQVWVDYRSQLVHSGNFDFRGSVMDTNRVNSKPTKVRKRAKRT